MATSQIPSTTTSSDPFLQSDPPTFSFNHTPRQRTNGSASQVPPTGINDNSPSHLNPSPIFTTSLPSGLRIPPSLLPHQPLSLSGISFRSFALGISLGSSLTLLPLLLYLHSPLWRPPFFIFLLSIFHYLEFHTTARYNPSVCTTSSFLLSANGSAYNIAHLSALIECLIRYLILPTWLPSLPASIQTKLMLAGFLMVLIGQTVRTAAMVQAGESFNHTVQTTKRDSHRLVKEGVYAWSRHPSYAGFWWWGVGGQLVLGNWVCLAGYVVVLWSFFRGRIRKEEEFLVKFFGTEYVEYRLKTRTGIPFIR